jgi:2-isopropylmalate synthase
MAFHVRADRLPYTTGIDTTKLYSTCQLLSSLAGQGVQVNKAIVGRNAFSHEAGIHQDGILKDRRTYEIVRAEDVGAPSEPLVLGKHSGRQTVDKRLSDLGLSVGAERMVAVYRALMDIADERKIVSDDDLVAVVKAVNEADVMRA